MSLTSLPNELLAIIAKLASNHHIDQTQNTEDSDVGYKVRCEASALVPLASVNRTLRCASHSTLFSRISVICDRTLWDDGLQAFERMLKRRQHIGQYVWSLSLRNSEGYSAWLDEAPMLTLCRCLGLQPSLRALSTIHNSPNAELAESVSNHPSLRAVNVNTLPLLRHDPSAVEFQGNLRRFRVPHLTLSSYPREFLALKTDLRLGMCLDVLTIDDVSIHMVQVSELDLSSLRHLDLGFDARKPLADSFGDWLRALVARLPRLARISFTDIAAPREYSRVPRWPDTTSLSIYPRLPILSDILSAPHDDLERFFDVHLVTHFTISCRKSLEHNVPAAAGDRAWYDQWVITELTLSCYDSPTPKSLPESMRYLFHNLDVLSLWHYYRDSDPTIKHWSLPIHPEKLADSLQECYQLDQLVLRRFDILPPDSSVDGPRDADPPFSSSLRFLGEALKAAIPSLDSIEGHGWHESKLTFWSCDFRRRPDGRFEAVTSTTI